MSLCADDESQTDLSTLLLLLLGTMTKLSRDPTETVRDRYPQPERKSTPNLNQHSTSFATGPAAEDTGQYLAYVCLFLVRVSILLEEILGDCLWPTARLLIRFSCLSGAAARLLCKPTLHGANRKFLTQTSLMFLLSLLIAARGSFALVLVRIFLQIQRSVSSLLESSRWQLAGIFDSLPGELQASLPTGHRRH